MVLKREVIERRLEELDATLGPARPAADHVLSGHFGRHSDTYQASLDGLHEEHVIPRDVHEELEGLGGFRNLLVHEYIELDSAEVHQNFQASFRIFPRFASAVLTWLREMDEG